ncbi:MAG: sugar ABC transporter permease [Eubacteriales bacterium]|nr:sugar ABC transporter permease [Eubacteriales bacterium]
MKKGLRFNLRGMELIAPAVLVMLVFTVYPIIYLIIGSFRSGSLIAWSKAGGALSQIQWADFKNYEYLLANADFGKIVGNTVLYVVMLVAGRIGCSLLLAWWLNSKINKRLSKTTQAIAFMPHVISLVSVSMVFMWLYNKDTGFFNSILTSLKLPACEFLDSEGTALISIVFVMLWKSLGYYTLLMLAAMQSVPKEVYEAAELDNAPAWRTFLRITIPCISPTIFFTTITATINSFNVFDVINLLTQGGPINSTNTLVYYIYSMMFKFSKPGVGCAAGVILLAIVGTLTIVYFRVMERRVHYQ